MATIFIVVLSYLVLFVEAFYVGNEKKIVTPIEVLPTVVNFSAILPVVTTSTVASSTTTVTTPSTTTTTTAISTEIEPRDQNSSNDIQTTTDSSLIEGQPISSGVPPPKSAPQPIPQEPPANPEPSETGTIQETNNEVSLDEKSGGNIEEVAEIDAQKPSEREIKDTESDGGMVDMNVTKIIQKTTTRREENTVVEEQYEYYSPAFVTNP